MLSIIYFTPSEYYIIMMKGDTLRVKTMTIKQERLCDITDNKLLNIVLQGRFLLQSWKLSKKHVQMPQMMVEVVYIL